MPEGGGIAMRTVWIALRATNYSEQAFRNAVKSVKDLTDAEKDERDGLLKTIDTAKLHMQTGVLYAAMLMMVTQRLGNLLMTTQIGSMYMAQFNQTLSELKTQFADTLFTALKPLLDALQWFMNILKDNAPLRNIIVYGGLLAIVIGGLYSAYLVLNAVMETNKAMTQLNISMSGKAVTANTAHAGSVNLLGISYQMLAVNIMTALGFAGTFYLILNSLNGPIKTIASAVMVLVGAITLLAFALNLVTFGASGISGAIGQVALLGSIGAIGAGGVGLAQSIPSYDVGIPYVPHTGPAIIHEGEAVLTKEQNNTRLTGNQGLNQTVHIDMSGMILQTKMNKEEFIPYLKRELRNIITTKE
jgi:hypothetical protein